VGSPDVGTSIHPHRTNEGSCGLAPDQEFQIGKAIEVISGDDVTIIATGLLVAESVRAAEALAADGISVRVLDFHTIKPLDVCAIEGAARQTGAIVVAEEHLVDGGWAYA
jgi:transketolase